MLPQLAEGKAEASLIGEWRRGMHGAIISCSQYITLQTRSCALQILQMDLCTVMLMDDSRYPAWLVLVPRRVRAAENIDCPA